MKILLGILEDDILEQDIGLSEIDPRNLAAGNLDEVVFVGQVLCQLGQERLGYRGHSSKEEDHIHVRPSSQANTITNTTTSGYQESETAPTSIFEGSITPNGNRSPPSRPKCIHDLEFPEFSLDDEDFEGDDDEPSRCACNCSIESHGISNLDVAGTSQSSIRYEGFIGRASELEEIREFESKNQRLPRVRYYDIFPIMFNLLCSQSAPPRDTLKIHNPNKFTFPTEYTLALLHERAQLLEELARLKLIRASESIHS